MLTPSSGTLADYNAAILNGNATHVRIVFPVQNKTFTDADITADGGITVNSILNGDTDLFMGKAVSREIIIHFLNNGQFTGFDWTEEFHVDFGVEISGSTNWVIFGYFTGVKPERVTRTEVIEFTAKDCMGSKFDVLADDFIASLSFPMDLGSIYSALCTYVGITSATGDEDSTVMSSSYSENPFVNGVSCRQIIAWIAEANCCYAKIDSANKVKLVWFKDQTSNYSITGDDYFSINVDESATPDIDVIRVNSAEDENARYMYPVGGNGVEYQIVDNPLLLNMLATDRTTALTKMLARLNAVCGYIPMSVSAIGNWMVEEGDIIEVTYDTSTTENMPVFARSLQWNGGCNDVYECTGNAERTEMSASDRESYITGGKLSNKYTIQSGIDITDEGITVSGGKWVKIVSGGTFDVDSTNFKIDSINKVMQVGDIYYTLNGIFRTLTYNGHEIMYTLSGEANRSADGFASGINIVGGNAPGIALYLHDRYNSGSDYIKSYLLFEQTTRDTSDPTNNIYKLLFRNADGGEFIIEADQFTGDLVGNVTGNVSGNVTGNLTGNVTGDVTGNVTGDLTGNVNDLTLHKQTYGFQISGGINSKTLKVYDSFTLNSACECVAYDGLDRTTAGAVLDARQGKALNDRLAAVEPLAQRYSFVQTSGNVTSASLNIPSNSAYLLIVNSNATGIHAVYHAMTTSTGALTLSKIDEAGITTTTSANTLTMAIGSTARPIFVAVVMTRGSAFPSFS